VALAAYVLRNTPGDWNAQKITAAMQASQSLRVNLSQPIKVMILYGTVLATEAGPVYFFDDLYGNDRRLARLLWPITRT
jgi:murein L,D-transpeptidase YcbB/YkuD